MAITNQERVGKAMDLLRQGTGRGDVGCAGPSRRFPVGDPLTCR